MPFMPQQNTLNLINLKLTMIITKITQRNQTQRASSHKI